MYTLLWLKLYHTFKFMLQFLHWLLYFKGFKVYLYRDFIEFIGVTLVNKIIQVSGVQLHIICALCVQHKSSFLPPPFIPPYLPPPPLHSIFPAVITTLLSQSMDFYCFFLFCSFHLPTSAPNPSPQQLSDCSVPMILPLFAC